MTEVSKMEALYRIAENENIIVIESCLPNSLNGFFYRNNRFNLICLKRELKKINKRITFAHELGRYFTSGGNVLFQDREFFNNCSRYEYLARKWIAEFLIPKERCYYILLILMVIILTNMNLLISLMLLLSL